MDDVRTQVIGKLAELRTTVALAGISWEELLTEAEGVTSPAFACGAYVDGENPEDGEWCADMRITDIRYDGDLDGAHMWAYRLTRRNHDLGWQREGVLGDALAD